MNQAIAKSSPQLYKPAIKLKRNPNRRRRCGKQSFPSLRRTLFVPRELEFADVAEGNGEAPKGLAVEESLILGRWRISAAYGCAKIRKILIARITCSM